MGQERPVMKKIIVHVLPWFFIIAGFAYVIHEAYQDNRQGSEWLVVSRVLVADATQGQPVKLFVDREIKKDFTGTWSVNVRRVTADALEIACTASGGGLYRKQATLPTPLTLDWWTFPVRCDLPPGQYVLDTVWRIQAASDRVKLVTASSRIFTIHP
jgi:hypothetical protein